MQITTSQASFHGKPCRKCGGTWRYVSGGKQCIPCKVEGKARSAKKKRANDPEYAARSREWSRAYFLLHPEKRSKYQPSYWGRPHGLPNGEAQRLLQAQLGLCAICRKEPGARRRIDHCHTSKKIRGILCQDCNLILGLARDIPEILLRAVDYLKNPPAIDLHGKILLSTLKHNTNNRHKKRASE